MHLLQNKQPFKMRIKTIGFIFTVMLIASCNQKQDKQLPVYNPTDLNPELVDKSLRNKNENHIVSDFNLINQNGEIITQENYENKIYVTDFFFTRCETICPIMTGNMAKIQKSFFK